MASLDAVWYGEDLSMRSTRDAIHEILKFFALGKASLGANPIRKHFFLRSLGMPSLRFRDASLDANPIRKQQIDVIT